jgi:AmmeMemoRadiSam system protein A
METAWNAIKYGLRHRTPLPVNPLEYPHDLQAIRASFVTLYRSGALRGCIGHLEAELPLVADIAQNAFAAAFRDPRFAPLTEAEMQQLAIHISILSPSEPLLFDSEQDLLNKIRPGVDGLILKEGHHQGTFLPSVWASLPEKSRFLDQLKQKAGLPPDYWSETLQVFRYETESFPNSTTSH